MKAWITIADFAQVHAGKLFVSGGGISLVQEGPSTFGVAVQVVVPWEERTRKRRFACTLFDIDGHATSIETPTGAMQIGTGGEFEVQAAPGSPLGMDLTFSLAFNVSGISLPAGSYQWRLIIDDEVQPSAVTAFYVQKAPIRISRS